MSYLTILGLTSKNVFMLKPVLQPERVHRNYSGRAFIWYSFNPSEENSQLFKNVDHSEDTAVKHNFNVSTI